MEEKLKNEITQQLKDLTDKELRFILLMIQSLKTHRRED